MIFVTFRKKLLQKNDKINQIKITKKEGRLNLRILIRDKGSSIKENWRSVDYLIFDGKQYFLMENQKYGKQSAAVILDQYGKLIADHCKNGFDEDAKRKFVKYLV